MKMTVFFLLVSCLAMAAVLVTPTEACQGHDQSCSGANGSQGTCCNGMHCQKNDPSWAEGRCYYNAGKK
ncbi:hypothetical protein BV898_04740 [Hypsibius exemplaris]|uniref:Uncharacterized protein n=1 Tax=Hypsibius exemplaris TaxID=2072580 RepID=A0A1W0X1C5_HYPEX|nr:hypothetical protein BV898_04740 [Hypsibius exemplaris]